MKFFKQKKKEENNKFAAELDQLLSLEDKIAFKHPIFGERHHEIFLESKAWMIESFKNEFKSQWVNEIQKFDNEILQRKNNQPEMVHFINEKILTRYINNTANKKTNNKWTDDERKEFIDFLKWLILNSYEMKNKNEIPAGLGGISVADLPQWYLHWKQKVQE